MKTNKVIKIITIILLIAIITIASIFGVYKLKDYKVRNIIPEYILGMEFTESRVIDLAVDRAAKTIIYDKDGNEISFIDILQDPKQPVEEKAQNKILYNKLIELINQCLTSREKEIIYLRYGLNGGIPLTQNEVAKILGISRSYISRIEKKAIEEIKLSFLKN